jgi:DNA-binding PadR family transcriptional regulator
MQKWVLLARPTLSRLERDGLVEADGVADGEGRVVYRITGAGRAEVAQWFSTPGARPARRQPRRPARRVLVAAAFTPSRLPLVRRPT